MKLIPEKAWNDFKSQHISVDIKDIAQGIVTTLIILVPESQIEAFKNSQQFQGLRTDYFNLVRQHTDEKISMPENITMHLESKENFDVKYKGSWYNYFG
ncbi:hypothetical protein [Flavisolibacter nicotianae]|uniref:hypothetical protein n=1 Tax=Flavisolibacter nicotianae TaxID=2364882 RepID=UPI000EB33A80|nr:hypothetical protein [Flavisolibacter nicotianae]